MWEECICHGLVLNFKQGKTEACITVRGTLAAEKNDRIQNTANKQLTFTSDLLNPPVQQQVTIVHVYEHLGGDIH